MLHNPDHEEYLARRERLGIITPKPFVKITKIERKTPSEISEGMADPYPYVSRETYIRDGITGRVVDMPNNLTWRQIVAETALKYGQTVRGILGPNQMPHLSLARQEVFYRLAKDLGFGNTKIGRVIGNRDHSTVYKGIKRHMMRIEIAAGHVEPPTPNFGVAFKAHSYEALESVAKLKNLGKSYKQIYEATGYTPNQAPAMYRRWLRIQELRKE